MAKRKIKFKVLLIIIFIGYFGTCDCKSLGLDYSTKSYIDEDRQHQVPETTTDFPKTTLSHFLNFTDGSKSLAQLWNEKTSKTHQEDSTQQNVDDEEITEILQTTTTAGETDFSGDNFSTNEIKISSFEDAESIEKRFHANENNRTVEERKFLLQGITNEETTNYYQTSYTSKTDAFGSDETENSEEKPRISQSVSTPKTNSSSKKGKNLDLLNVESENVNLTIPNNAAVWSLAGMKNIIQTTGTIDKKRESKQNDEETTERRDSTHSDAKTLSDWIGIARIDDLKLAHSNETDELFTTTTDSTEITTQDQGDKNVEYSTLQTVSDEEKFISSTGYSNVEDKLTAVETTIDSEKPIETTTHSGEFLRSTESSDEITISSALSRTTEPANKIVLTTTSDTSTTAQKVKTSSMSTSTTTSATIAKDEYLSASSEPVFRVTSLYDTTFYTENDRDKYSAVNELQITTDSSEITTRKQNVNDENTDTSSGSLGVISAVISVVVLLSLIALLYFVIKKRKEKQVNQRCRPVPVGLDAYSLDNVSVFSSIRRKANAIRASKRSYDNSAFEDPTLRSNVLDLQTLKEFVKKKKSIEDEFKNIPAVSARIEDVPENVEDKNRFANVLPLSQTRVMLQRMDDDEKSEYINANYVKGPKDTTNYYIATQGPLECTIPDFWRMMWEQNSRVILMLTDFHENGIEKCAQYIPSSVILDNSQTFGDFEVTLKSREVKEKYAVSKIHLKNLQTKTWREVTHFWYSWPTDRGSPSDEMSVISLLLEARTFLSKTMAADNLDENSNMDRTEKISTLDKTKSLQKIQGPLTVHCNNGVGRTGAVIACDIVLRSLEVSRQVDIPQIVYKIRRDRANSIRTKDQYEFIYNIANAYASKLTTSNET